MWHRGQQNGGQVEQALHGRLGEAGPRGQGEAPGSMVKIIMVIIMVIVKMVMIRDVPLTYLSQPTIGFFNGVPKYFKND